MLFLVGAFQTALPSNIRDRSEADSLYRSTVCINVMYRAHSIPIYNIMLGTYVGGCPLHGSLDEMVLNLFKCER